MKKKIFGSSLVLLIVMLVLGLLGCPGGDTPKPKLTEALLSSITVENQANMIFSQYGNPITQQSWDGLSSMSTLAANQTGSFLLGNMVNVAVNLAISDKATALFTRGFNGNVKPDDTEFVFSSGDSVTFFSDQFFYVKVTSESKKVTNYYRFEVLRGQGGAIIEEVTFGATSVSGNAAAPGDALGLPDDDWDLITSPGRVTLTNTQALGVSVTAVPASNTVYATITFAKLAFDATPGTEPVFGANNNFAFENGDSLFIRVVSDDKLTTQYYQIEIITGYVAGLSSVSIGDFDFDEGDIPTPGTTWGTAGQTYVFFTNIADMDDVEINITVPLDSGATLSVALNVDAVLLEPDFTDIDASDIVMLDLVNGDTIYIKVTSANGEVEYFYRFVAVAPGSAPPGEFILKIGDAIMEWAHRGTSHTGNLTFNQNATNMGKIFMTEAQMKNAAVEVFAGPGSSAKVQKGTITGTATNVAVMGAATWTTATNTIAASDFFGKDYVQVEFTTGATTVYYSIYIRKIVNIPYVDPALITFVDTTAETPWNNAAVITVDRVFGPNTSNVANITGGFDYQDPSTHAKVKLLWNENGIYSLAEVLDSTESINRPAEYNDDCVEIFMAENNTVAADGNSTISTGWRDTANAGGQYRSSRNGKLSADLAFNGSNNENAASETMTALGKIDTVNNGYIIKARYGWINNPATVAAWVTGGKTIMFEAQVAYANAGADRNGVLMWNSFHISAYESSGNHGVANLLPKP